MGQLSAMNTTYRIKKRNNSPPLNRELMDSIRLLCSNKADEFNLYGYENVTSQQIWTCISEKYRHGWPKLNRLVNDILSLKANHFMNWLMLRAIKDEKS